MVIVAIYNLQKATEKIIVAFILNWLCFTSSSWHLIREMVGLLGACIFHFQFVNHLLWTLYIYKATQAFSI